MERRKGGGKEKERNQKRKSGPRKEKGQRRKGDLRKQGGQGGIESRQKKQTKSRKLIVMNLSVTGMRDIHYATVMN